MLGNNIKQLRKKENITQEQLANAIGIKRTTLSLIENEKLNPSSKTMEKISLYLRFELGEVFFIKKVS